MQEPIYAFWCRYPSAANFGDALTPWLIHRLTGRHPVFAWPREPVPKHLVTGSIIEYACRHTIVWGAGILTLGDAVAPDATILAVRGPLTRRRALECGARCPTVLGDPALLLSQLYTPEPGPRTPLGVVPHYFDKPKVAARWRPSQQARLIDVQQRVERVIDEVAACDRVVSSSLHGLIAAHAYGVPALWVRFGDNLLGDGSKFHDYLASVGQDVDQPIRLDHRGFDPERLLALVPAAPRFDTDSLWEACPFRGGR
jgi:hypothetical protein